MLPALVDRSGAPSLDISSFDLDDAALTRLASRGLFDDLHRFTFSHSKTKASSLEPLLDHEDALEGVRHLSIFGWDVSERDVNRLARRGALVSIRRSGKAMKGDLTDDEVRAADLETAALLSDHPDLRHVYFGYSGNLGEATLEVLLGGEGPGRFDQADVVMRVPTDSPLLAIARDTDGFVFSDVDDHVKVSLHLLANHGARPLLMDGTYRRD